MPRYPAHSPVNVSLTLNGRRVSADCVPRRLLSDFLRHDLGATGTHVGCEHGVCGACTVLMNGKPVRSCLTLAIQALDCEILTIEGLATDQRLDDLRAAFRKHHALQCGFCTPGFLTTLHAWLESDPDPSDESSLREYLSGNLCRCTGYVGIIDAAKEVAAGRKASAVGCADA